MSILPMSSIVVKKVVKATREKVYEAWVNPEIRKQWWKSDSEFLCKLCDIDNKIDGHYRIGMVKKDTEYIVIGKFLELTPPSRIKFTWEWEHQPDFAKDSIVTVELHEVDIDGISGTEVVLIHEKLEIPLSRSEHNQGWAGCLVSLALLFDPEDASSCEK